MLRLQCLIDAADVKVDLAHDPLLALKALPPRLKPLQRLAVGWLGEQQRDVQIGHAGNGFAARDAAVEVNAMDERRELAHQPRRQRLQQRDKACCSGNAVTVGIKPTSCPPATHFARAHFDVSLQFAQPAGQEAGFRQHEQRADDKARHVVHKRRFSPSQKCPTN